MATLIANLPPELRNMLYEYIVVDHGHAIMLPSIPTLLQVNHQLREEAGAIFFRMNTFAMHFWAEGALTRHWPMPPRSTTKWVSMVGLERFSQIRWFYVCVRRSDMSWKIFDLILFARFDRSDLGFLGQFDRYVGIDKVDLQNGVIPLVPQSSLRIPLVAGASVPLRYLTDSMRRLFEVFRLWRSPVAARLCQISAAKHYPECKQQFARGLYEDVSMYGQRQVRQDYSQYRKDAL